MNAFNYLGLAFLAGVAARSTQLSIEKPLHFRPMAFQRGVGSLIWDILAIAGVISMTALPIYGFNKIGSGPALLGVLVFFAGLASGYSFTRFGPTSPVSNLILTIAATRLLL